MALRDPVSFGTHDVMGSDRLKALRRANLRMCDNVFPWQGRSNNHLPSADIVDVCALDAFAQRADSIAYVLTGFATLALVIYTFKLAMGAEETAKRQQRAWLRGY